MNHNSLERISEEANGCVFPSSFLNDLFPDLELSIFGELSSTDIPVDGTCDFDDIDIVGAPVEPNEIGGNIQISNSQSLSFEYDNNRALMNTLPVQIIRTEKKSRSSAKPILLSGSVGVGAPQKTTNSSRLLQILHDLEQTFRPRYKSDYFAQNGKSRKPRYVADRTGNHFISLQVPVNLRGKIRIDWLTIPDQFGNRYSMPYRFQQSNESSDIPDCNPLYLNITTDKNGIMKLYLVLIKSKQDELKNLQPLIPFQPWTDAIGAPDKSPAMKIEILNPKKLIQKYHLDQSQLAFTFCAPSADGQTCIPQWDTTAYSTTLTELPPENTKKKAVVCPNCTHCFDIQTVDQDSVQETLANKRKDYQYADEHIVKKQNSFEMD